MGRIFTDEMTATLVIEPENALHFLAEVVSFSYPGLTILAQFAKERHDSQNVLFGVIERERVPELVFLATSTSAPGRYVVVMTLDVLDFDVMGAVTTPRIPRTPSAPQLDGLPEAANTPAPGPSSTETGPTILPLSKHQPKTRFRFVRP